MGRKLRSTVAGGTGNIYLNEQTSYLCNMYKSNIGQPYHVTCQNIASLDGPGVQVLWLRYTIASLGDKWHTGSR